MAQNLAHPKFAAGATFGHLLKHWREQRRLSQSALADSANVSGRHLSFLESGRAQPSREMVRQLGRTLDLPLQELNALHLAAGFVPPYGSSNLNISEAPYARQALDFILTQQHPYPALVIDGQWNIRLRNTAASQISAYFRCDYEMGDAISNNAMHAVFHPKGLRQFIINWEEFAGELIQILHREVAQGSHASARLLAEVMEYPGAVMPRAPAAIAASPVMTMQLQKGDLRLSFFATFTSFAMPSDAALQQLKIECFYPADAATADFTRNLAP